jgi:hypothetical protein
MFNTLVIYAFEGLMLLGMLAIVYAVFTFEG